MEVRSRGGSGGDDAHSAQGVQELRRLCDDVLAEAGKDGEGGAEAELQSSPERLQRVLPVGGTTFSVKLVDAQFPPYAQVIPEATERAVRVPRLPFSDALRAVSLAASDRTGGVKLTIENGKLRFESESPESGEGFDEVPIEYDGPTLTVGFNARYFLDVLGAMTEDEVIIGISGELDPAVIKPATESTKQSYLAVVMPMRI